MFNNYLLFLISQENVDTVRQESDMDIVTEEHPTGIKTEEVCQPSAVCVEKAEPEVSLIYDGGLSGGAYECVCICVCVSVSSFASHM